ncbi:MAG: serine hydrolase domain-containing protein [Pseudomonadales bacterium]
MDVNRKPAEVAISQPIETVASDLDFSPLHERMRFYVDEGILSCANTLIMRGTDVLDFARFGYMDLDSRRPLTEDAIYRMYSNTKIVTSVAAMQLVEQGRIGLDDPVSDYIPAFADMQVLKADAASVDDVEPAREPMRVRHILSHSAGLSYGFIEPTSIVDQAYAAAGINALASAGLTLESLCDKLGNLPLAYEPGTRWRYSFATDVTARLVEVVSGRRFDDYLTASIFEPLAMTDTDFWVPPEKRDRFVTMYAPEDIFDPMKPGLTKADDPHEGTYTRQPSFLSGGGGLVSTVQDYLAFIRMIVNGGSWQGAKILDPATLERMRANQLPAGVGVSFPMWDMPGTVFGLGFALKETLAEGEPPAMQDEYHWGGMAGTHSWMAPRAGITGMCMTQRMPGFWHPFSHEFKLLAYRITG